MRWQSGTCRLFRTVTSVTKTYFAPSSRRNRSKHMIGSWHRYSLQCQLCYFTNSESSILLTPVSNLTCLRPCCWDSGDPNPRFYPFILLNFLFISLGCWLRLLATAGRDFVLSGTQPGQNPLIISTLPLILLIFVMVKSWW